MRLGWQSRRLACCLTSASEALVVLACGFDRVLRPWKLGEAGFGYGFVRLDAQAVGSVGDAFDCFVDLVDEFAVRGGEVEIEALLKAFGTKLCCVACSLGFAGA